MHFVKALNEQMMRIFNMHKFIKELKRIATSNTHIITMSKTKACYNVNEIKTLTGNLLIDISYTRILEQLYLW